MQVEKFAEYIQEKTNVICIDYIKKIKAEIGKFIGFNKSVIISKYDDINFEGTEDFLEVIEIYGVYKDIPDFEFKMFLDKDNVPLYMVLKHKKIVDYFDYIVKDKIMSNSYNAETILSKFLETKDLYLPPSLTEEDILKLVDDYIKIDAERIKYKCSQKNYSFPNRHRVEHY